ncbi:hypothetical protein [Paenibacillus massiliensis]|uniref:hypothetical protein n=1 Tax=Paenibacillus massiliensis TaxID=225917 RepID=UPI00048B8B9D|nr:hypothetical protein [Paenibacillus massiliensis]
MTPQNRSDYEMLSYEETTFIGLLKIDKLRAFKNWSILWAIILTVFVVLFISIKGDFQSIVFEFSKEITSTLLGASAGIFGIVIAALTLTLTLFHQSLLPIMLREKLLQKYLFPFWFAVVLWAVNIVVCVFLTFLHVIKLTYVITPIFIFEFFVFLFATFYTVKLTGLVIRLALQRAQMDS